MALTTLRITTTGRLLDGAAPETVQANLDRFVIAATALVFANVKKHTPQGVYGAQGGLLASIQSEVTGKGTPLVKGTVLTAQKYAEPVEKGRTPGKGMPPRGSLVRWLEVKLGLSEKEASRIEYVVRRKIGLKGTKGARMFERGVRDSLPRLDAMARSMGLTVTEELNG